MGAAAPPRMGGQAMMGGAGMTMGRPMMGMGAMGSSPGETGGIGLKPERHIAGFSIRKEDGTALPLIFEAGVGKARDTVVLKLSGPVPANAVALVRPRVGPVLQPDGRVRHGGAGFRPDRARRGRQPRAAAAAPAGEHDRSKC